MLDTCFSGDAAAQAGAKALLSESQRRVQDAGYGSVMVAASRPSQLATAGAFTTALARAVESPATAGYSPAALDISMVVRVMNGGPVPLAQRVIWIPLGALSGTLPPFLPNPRRDPGLANVDLLVQVRAEERARLGLEHRGRSPSRATASYGHSDAWSFTGRHAALTRITSWLDEPTADQRALVVTGGPGSGKTAVLGLLSMLADPGRRRSVPVTQMGLPKQARPEPGSIDVTIYAGSLTSSEVLRDLADAAGVAADNAKDLISKLAGRSTPLTCLVDAVDEAANHDELISEVLQPLIGVRDRAPVRLLLGTRRHLIPLLGALVEQVDLDDEAYADPESLRDYTRRCLLEATPDSPYATAEPHVVQEVAGAVAAAAGYSFLIARIISRTLGEADSIPDPSDMSWRAGLPRRAGPAIRADLDQRLGADADRAIDLLVPLAFAEGQGLPWDICPAIASRIAGRTYTYADLEWLRQRVGSYIVEAEGQYSAYHLYHRALTEFVRADRDPVAVHSAFVDVLARTAMPAPGARPDWTLAHPYAQSYLASHAAAARRLDTLLLDPGFLLVAEQGRLLEALSSAHAPPAVRAASAYRDALNPSASAGAPERLAYLRLTALCNGATELAAAVGDTTSAGWRAQWAIWDPTDSNEIITGHAGPVTAIAVTEIDGHPVAVTACRNNGELRLADLHTLAPAGVPVPTGHCFPISTVAVVQLDGRIVIVSVGEDVRLTDLETREPTRVPIPVDKIGPNVVTQLKGRPAVVVASGDTVHIWDLTSRTSVTRPIRTGHPYGIGALALTEMDRRLVVVTAGTDTWDPKKGKVVDDTLRLWDLDTGARVGDPIQAGMSCRIDKIWVTEVADRPTAIIANTDDSYGFVPLRMVDLSLRTSAAVGDDHQILLAGGIGAMTVADLGDRPVAVTASSPLMRLGWVQLWDLRRRAAIRSIKAAPLPIGAITVTLIGGRATAIVGGADGSLRVVSLRKPARARNPADLEESTAVAEPRIGPITQIAVTQLAGRPLIVTTNQNDALVRLWDENTAEPAGAPVRNNEIHIGAMAVVQPNGQPTVITSGPASVRADIIMQLWDLATRNPVGRPMETGNLLAVTEAHGRPTAITSGPLRAGAHRLDLWDVHTQARIRTFPTGDTRPVAIAASRIDDHPVAVTLNRDGTARLWDLHTGFAVSGQLGPAATAYREEAGAVAVTQVDGLPVVLAGGSDGTVRLWDLGPVRFPRGALPLALRTVRRSLTRHVVGRVALAALCCAVIVSFVPHLLSHEEIGLLTTGMVALNLWLLGRARRSRARPRQRRMVEPSDTYDTGSPVTALCCRPYTGGVDLYVGSHKTVVPLRAQRQASRVGLAPLGISVDVQASITSLAVAEPDGLLVGTTKGMVRLDFPDSAR
jgi:WD40 repeat protein